jgi:hypothetical protein
VHADTGGVVPPVVGIDYDTFGVHLCLLAPGHPPMFHTCGIRDKGQDPFDACQNVASALVHAANHIGAYGVDGWIERGHGSQRRSDFPLGAIYGAVVASYGRAFNAAIRSMPTADWKRHIGAKGNARKTDAHTHVLHHLAAHHPTLDPPRNTNHLDAYAIATTAQHTRT